MSVYFWKVVVNIPVYQDGQPLLEIPKDTLVGEKWIKTGMIHFRFNNVPDGTLDCGVSLCSIS